MTDKTQTLRQALDAELARQRGSKPTMAETVAAQVDPNPVRPARIKDASSRQRKLVRGTAAFAEVEARALADELNRIATLTIRGERQTGQDTGAMHTARLRAWANVAKIRDCLTELGNEIDRMGE